MERSELLERFSMFDWGDVGKKLTAFVIQYMNYCTGRKFKDWNLPGGHKAEDIAYKAITDVLTGKRNWNPETDPDFLRYMQFSVCRSIISNLYSKADAVKTEKQDQADYFSADGEDKFEYYSGTHINFGLHFEQEIDNAIFIDRLDRALADDETGQLVLLSVLDGNANRHIAADLGISESEVSNAKKRIKRAAEKILSSLN
ncbi:hypothetical protein [Arachidicoccus sp.]|uniref:hypothetical protein n=1 Tax=Arachidicoccus sp. TaxID=1872624 RepID=UPI003D24FA5F